MEEWQYRLFIITFSINISVFFFYRIKNILKIKKNLISIEKMCYNEFQKALSEQLLLNFLYLGFILFLHFSI